MLTNSFDHLLISDFNFKPRQRLVFCDEVGRGTLAGPVVAGCVSFHFEQSAFIAMVEKFLSLGVTDSKKLNDKKREMILEKLGISFECGQENADEVLIFKHKLFDFAIASCSSQTIDQENILKASLMAMANGTKNLLGEQTQGFIFIDGNKIFLETFQGFKQISIIEGDAKSVFIGLSSIIAKVYRDRLMKKIHQRYPEFGLDQHAGYATKTHREAIVTFGVTDVHRKSFGGVKEHVEKKYQKDQTL